jgi:1-acyl-sn-glycerol-3-phosphate acyltransferase
MQNVVIDKPYAFVPPHPGDFWPRVMRAFMPSYLRKYHGLESLEFAGRERLETSRAAGHGIMLAPNHCRPCDPMVLGLLAAGLSQPLYIMASWHLFMQGRLLPWLLPRLGVFSVYREGLDREALKCAIQILVAARRPLVVFPEGLISRTNDRLNPLMDGTVFMARSAARQRKDMAPPGKVVIHPVAIRYFFCADVGKAVTPVLEDIERRLSWQPQRDKALVDRIVKVGDALLTLKELEYAEQPRGGTLAERIAALIDQLLVPLENEWLKGRREGPVPSRVKALRTAILPEMVSGDTSEEERARRWRQLADIYLAQQLFLYPPDYFSTPPTPEQLLETVERFEEDLTDRVRVHRPMHVAVEVGEAIEVNPARERGVESDPVMARVRGDIEAMLVRLKERRPAPQSELSVIGH